MCRGTLAAALPTAPALAALGQDEIRRGQLVALTARSGYALGPWLRSAVFRGLGERKQNFGCIKSCPRYHYFPATLVPI